MLEVSADDAWWFIHRMDAMRMHPAYVAEILPTALRTGCQIRVATPAELASEGLTIVPSGTGPNPWSMRDRIPRQQLRKSKPRKR